MWEKIAIGLVVGLAAAYLVWSLLRAARGRRGGVCRCHECPYTAECQASAETLKEEDERK